jgi:hypothetical protein
LYATDDGSGLLDRDETKTLMLRLFPGISDAEFDVAFAKMDDDGSGEVDFDEFAAWWKAELKEKGAELEARMIEVREQMKLKKMAMQLYNADPNEDTSKLKANLATRAAKLKKDAKEKVRCPSPRPSRVVISGLRHAVGCLSVIGCATRIARRWSYVR